MSNYTEIRHAMHVLPAINVADEITMRVNFIRATLDKSGAEALVLGISGGVDSALLGTLAQMAVSKSYEKFYAVRLPYEAQADEADAQFALTAMNPDVILDINIGRATDFLHGAVSSALPIAEADHFAKGNVKARMRMAAQYEVAGVVNGLVLGTDHSAENVVGFYTKHGDGACDLAPLFGLNKRQVRALATAVGVPESIVNKVPTADLECDRPGIADEEALGLTYDEIDDFLEGKDVAEEVAIAIRDLYNNTQHKRQLVPTIYD